MDDVPLIVEKLNGPPFRKNLRLVELDEKSPFERLQLLNEVFAAMDPAQQVDLREESHEARLGRVYAFLSMLKYPKLPTDEGIELFSEGLRTADKNFIYSLLHWLLSKFEHHRKRAYLAKYLSRIEIPAEYLADDHLAKLMQELQALQREFTQVHKAVDQLRGRNIRPNELRTEIVQLEEERKQLEEKIRKQKKATEDEEGFQEMLAITSELRQAQEAEARTQDRLREQRIALHNAEQHYTETVSRSNEMRSSNVHLQSAEGIVQQLEREVSALAAKVNQELVRDLKDKQRRFAALEAELRGPMRTEADVADARKKLSQIEAENSELRAQIDEAVDRDTRLAAFRQTVMLASGKLRKLEEDLETLQTERAKLSHEVQEAEMKIANTVGQRLMPEKEMAEFTARLKEKYNVYEKMKNEIKNLKAEQSVLQLTEQVLKRKHHNLDQFLSSLEAKKGAVGYRKTQRAIEEASAATAMVDQRKAQTLEEISRIVAEIGRQVNDKKAELTPILNQLKVLRRQYVEVESEYVQKRRAYEKIAVALEVEKQQLEQECDMFQEECLREESRYHFLSCLISINRVLQQRAQLEEACEKGEKQLLKNFASFKELYNHKLVQLEHLAKQLRAQQKELREDESESVRQKEMFGKVRALMEAKKRSRQAQLERKADDNGETTMIDGANVMRMD